MTKEELITDLILLGFVKSPVQWNRYKHGRALTLIIIEFNVPNNVSMYMRHIKRSKQEISYDEALEQCVKLLNR